MGDRFATVGSRAPGFRLACTGEPGQPPHPVTLDDYENRWLILLFYPRDFSLVCPTELSALSARLDEFHQRECALLGVSTDSVETHQRWLSTPRSQGGLAGLRFPLASDEDGTVCRAYGVYVPRQHLALRGLFIIDPNGVLQYAVVHNLSVGRRSEEVLRVLDALQTGGLCAEGWTPDQATLDVSETLRPGSVLGQFRIDAVLGAGSFGSVFRANDLLLQRTVALKVLRSNAQLPSIALLNEARAAAALNHPNVCTIFAVEADDGVPMIVMEYIEGQPLNKMLDSGPLPPPRVADIARQVAQGMAAAHDQGIIHGDLKPGNILVSTTGLAKIMDFGLARQLPRASRSNETVVWQPAADTGGLSGTPRYMAPEHARNQPVTAASDIFAFGLVLYELLVGRPAISGNNLMDVLRQLDTLDAQKYANRTPEPFATILRQALVNDPRDRTMTMSRIADLLDATAASA